MNQTLYLASVLQVTTHAVWIMGAAVSSAWPSQEAECVPALTTRFWRRTMSPAQVGGYNDSDGARGRRSSCPRALPFWFYSVGQVSNKTLIFTCKPAHKQINTSRGKTPLGLQKYEPNPNSYSQGHKILLTCFSAIIAVPIISPKQMIHTMSLVDFSPILFSSRSLQWWFRATAM